MHRSIYLSIALVIVHALSACSSTKKASGDTRNDAEASIPLKFANDWNLSVVAGNPGGMGAVDGLALDARFYLIKGIARSGDKLYLSDSNNVAIREYDITTNKVTTLAGHLGSLDFTVLNGVGLEAYFRRPGQIAVLGQHLYVSDDSYTNENPAQLRSIELSTGEVRTIDDPSTGGPWNPTGDSSLILASSASRLYVAGDEVIYEFDPIQNTFGRVVGVPEQAQIVDGDADTARFGSIGAMSHDGENGLYVMDNNDLRLVDLTKPAVKTLAGSDHLASDAGVIRGYIGLADGTGENAQFDAVLSISYNDSKTYLADSPAIDIYMEKGPLAYAYQYGRLRAYDATTNAVDTIAGYLPRPTAVAGEADGPAETARFLFPRAVYADNDYVYVGSWASLRRMSKTTGQVELVAGTLITSPFFGPGALTLVDGSLYTFSKTQLAIMSIDIATGAISTVVGYHHDQFRTDRCSPIAEAAGSLYCASYYLEQLTGKDIYRLYKVNLSNSNVETVSSLLGIPITDMVSDGNDLLVLGERIDRTLHLWRIDSSQDDTAEDRGSVDLKSSYASSYARLAVSNGSAYITDGTRVVRHDLATGETKRIAGSDSESGCADGIADQARFTQLTGIAASPGGLFIADGMCHTVSFLSLDTGKVTQLAGGPANMIFKPGQGPEAGVNWPSRLVYDSSNQALYISDSMDNVIGRLTPAKQ